MGVMEELADEHELPAMIVNFRQLSKLKSTYIDALPLEINPRTGRVHTSYNQTVAATGRLSSSDPNLQNIPIRSDLGKEIRQAFVADKNGWGLSSEMVASRISIVKTKFLIKNLVWALNASQRSS